MFLVTSTKGICSLVSKKKNPLWVEGSKQFILEMLLPLQWHLLLEVGFLHQLISLIGTRLCWIKATTWLQHHLISRRLIQFHCWTCFSIGKSQGSLERCLLAAYPWWNKTLITHNLYTSNKTLSAVLPFWSNFCSSWEVRPFQKAPLFLSLYNKLHLSKICYISVNEQKFCWIIIIIISPWEKHKKNPTMYYFLHIFKMDNVL